mmetsp:Transcript_30801/g.35677  ORF Transcript_30801/g.35677 Transcript_30801/m.35677 type:complete len:754 (-) Transcript_30801:21-2282(-)
MGQQTSFFEYSQEVAKLHYAHCSLSHRIDDPTWKILFLSPMTDDEICSFFSFDDVRKLRRYHPDRLALVLFKCIEQLVDFVERYDDILDYCSVMNSLRMLGNALPYCFEDIQLEGSKVKESTITTSRTLQKLGDGKTPISPFAEHFAEHFFWKNETCEGSDIHVVDHVWKWVSTSKSTTWHSAPLGETVVKTLTQLCFIPRFTVGDLQRFTPPVNPIDVEMTAAGATDGAASLTKIPLVHDELLWFGAPQKTGVVPFRQINPRRILVLRALTQCISWNVFHNDPHMKNPFLDVFVDERRNPMAPTLCVSMLNRIATHYSKGTLPWTSYMQADEAEKVLSQSIALLSATFDVIDSESHRNCFARVLRDIVDKDSMRSETLVIGLHRVIDNPLFASRTFFKGSQKVVTCTLEALVLLFHVIDLPNVQALTIKHQRYLLHALLYFVQECARNDSLLHEMQCAIFILLRLSSKPAFLKVIQEPIAAQPPLVVLPDLTRSEHASLADVLVLMLCFVVSPASPRWFLNLLPATATIFSNVMVVVPRLTEITCFEIHHSLDFLCQRQVLKRGAPTQESCQLWVDGIVNAVRRNPNGYLPLKASLGVNQVGKRLQKLIAGESDAATLENSVATNSEESKNGQPKSKSSIKWIEGFAEGMPLNMLLQISKESEETLAAVDVHNLNNKREDAYKCIAEAEQQHHNATTGLVIPSSDGEPIETFIRDFTVTLSVRQWVSGTLWRAIHRSNLRPPIYDFKTVLLY